VVTGSVAGRPVRARKASSRLGWPRVTSATPTSASASRVMARPTSRAASAPAASSMDRASGSSPSWTGLSRAWARTRRACGRCSPSRSRTCRVPEPTRDLSCALVPSATIRPWSMTAICSASWSASSRYWVVSSTVVPAAAIWRTSSHTRLRLRGSSPVVGSSRNSRSGVTIRLAAMSSRRRIPPEYPPTVRPAASVRSNAASSSSARRRPPARGRPCRRPRTIRFSYPVRSSSRAANWPVTATRARIASRSPTRSCPRTRAVPPSARVKVARMRIVVVLPAPLGPRNPYTWPRRTVRSIPSSARLPP